MMPLQQEFVAVRASRNFAGSLNDAMTAGAFLEYFLFGQVDLKGNSLGKV